jgi:hypothetical protein
LTNIQLGEVDAGIVITSDLSGKGLSHIGRLEILEAMNVIASYPLDLSPVLKIPLLHNNSWILSCHLNDSKSMQALALFLSSRIL